MYRMSKRRFLFKRVQTINEQKGLPKTKTGDYNLGMIYLVYDMIGKHFE